MSVTPHVLLLLLIDIPIDVMLSVLQRPHMVLLILAIRLVLLQLQIVTIMCVTLHALWQHLINIRMYVMLYALLQPHMDLLIPVMQHVLV